MNDGTDSPDRRPRTDPTEPEPTLAQHLDAIEGHVRSIRAFLTRYRFDGTETPTHRRALLASAFRALHEQADECDAELMRTLIARLGPDAPAAPGPKPTSET